MIVTTSMIDFARLLRDIPSGDWVALSEGGQAIVACGPDRCAVPNKRRTEVKEIP